MLSPFTVIRGRVVGIEGGVLPVVSGTGNVRGGWGSVRVRTDFVETGNALWVRDRDGQDHKFNFDGTPLPDVLQGHAVTVALFGDQLAAFVNHSTGYQTFYRPAPPYRVAWGQPSPASGEDNRAWLTPLAMIGLVACLGSIAFGLDAFATCVVLCASVWGIVRFAFRSQQKAEDQTYFHNAALDRELMNLIELPDADQSTDLGGEP